MKKIANVLSVVAITASLVGPVNATSIIAGYLDATATGSASIVNMNQVAKDGYNTVIIGFAKVTGSNISWLTSSTKDIANQQAAASNKVGMKTLLSIGGQANTWEPGSLSDSGINILAKNIVSFALENGFSGVDFDLEVETDPLLLSKLLTEMKTLDPKIIITAAPQINNGKIVTTGNYESYKDAINAGLFDYLFIQEYNTLPQNDANFIYNSFLELKSQIPVGTKIIVGEPTAAVAAGKVSLYYPVTGKVLTTQEATAEMLPQLKKINSDPQFGGVMGWSLNVDYDAIDYGDSNHISGTYAYGLKDCVVYGLCARPPTPKKPLPNFTLQTTNTSTEIGLVLEMLTSDGAKFKSDYIGPDGYKVYSKTTKPVNVAMLENKQDITVKWSTYQGGPSGECPGTFDLTHNENVLVNPTSGVCAFKTVT